MYFVQYGMFFEYNSIFYYRSRNDKEVDFCFVKELAYCVLFKYVMI